MSEWSSTNVTHPDESEIQRGGVSPLPLSFSPSLPLTHTHTDQSKATAGKSVVWERKKKSINASVGLPWLEHGTVSLLSGCVNLFCLMCCKSVSRLKHSSVPACFFLLFHIFFPSYSDSQWLCSAQSFWCFPYLSVARPRANAGWNIESHTGALTAPAVSGGAARSSGTALHDGNLSVLHQASEGARWCRADLSSLSSFSASENFLFPHLGWLEYFWVISWILSGFEVVVNERFIFSATSVNFVGKIWPQLGPFIKKILRQTRYRLGGFRSQRNQKRNPTPEWRKCIPPLVRVRVRDAIWVFWPAVKGTRWDSHSFYTEVWLVYKHFSFLIYIVADLLIILIVQTTGVIKTKKVWTNPLRLTLDQTVAISTQLCE